MTQKLAAGTLRGSLFMTLAMGLFAVEDLFIKLAARDMLVAQVLILFGGLGATGFVLLALWRNESPLPRYVWTPHMALRSAFELGGRLFYTLAIALTPLSSASAILQATPLVVTLGAVLFLQEQVGARRWIAMGAGFAGVIMILRPGADSFEPLSIFAVLGMVGFAGRDLATRAAPPVLSNAQLGFAGFLMLIAAGLVLLPFGDALRSPAPEALGAVALAAVIGVAAYSCLTTAMRSGEIGVVAPFRYTRLLFALLLAVIWLGERPDLLTLLGAAVIVGSGLYSLLRDRRVKRRNS